MKTNGECMYNRLIDERRFINSEFMFGVGSFIEYPRHQPALTDCDKIRCPCCKCQNRKFLLLDEVKLHLTRNGFVKITISGFVMGNLVLQTLCKHSAIHLLW